MREKMVIDFTVYAGNKINDNILYNLRDNILLINNFDILIARYSYIGILFAITVYGYNGEVGDT